jgi:hypothetical protein
VSQPLPTHHPTGHPGILVQFFPFRLMDYIEVAESIEEWVEMVRLTNLETALPIVVRGMLFLYATYRPRSLISPTTSATSDDESDTLHVQPWTTRCPPGRPKKGRIHSAHEQRQAHEFTCSRCGQKGHSKQTCCEPINQAKFAFRIVDLRDRRCFRRDQSIYIHRNRRQSLEKTTSPHHH